MMEKFIVTPINKNEKYIYNVILSGCIIMKGKHKENNKMIYWFTFNKADEMKESLDKYEYFIDDDGDIARKLR